MTESLSPHSKVVTKQELLLRLKALRPEGRSVVFTNGCFDILHKGHIEYLYEASLMGNILIIGLNSDDSVRRLKGPGRPVLDQESRSLILASLYFVDFVILFSDDTPYTLISIVEPDILVKGGDYKPEEIVGYDIVTGKGGRVITIPLIDGYSSSSIIRKLDED
jgi:rfaE bifunctional protein nucleotidyltransferase chain/domain